MTRMKWLLATIVLTATAVSGVVVATRDGAEAVQEPPASRGPITPHAYPLDDAHYLRWALPPGHEAYGRIDGERLKTLGGHDHGGFAEEP